ncbi:MAG: hypothetical protein ACMXX7_02430 [Candidatus Woesearchaeota archaeon]
MRDGKPKNNILKYVVMTAAVFFYINSVNYNVIKHLNDVTYYTSKHRDITNTQNDEITEFRRNYHSRCLTYATTHSLKESESPYIFMPASYFWRNKPDFSKQFKENPRDFVFCNSIINDYKNNVYNK